MPYVNLTEEQISRIRRELTPPDHVVDDEVGDILDALTTNTKTRVVIVLEGGLIQSIVSDIPDHLDVAVIDYDTDGTPRRDLSGITQSDGSVSEAVVSLWGVAEEPDIALDEVFAGGLDLED